MLKDCSSVPFLFVVACALVDARGKILLTQRPANKDFAHMYEFPGGKREIGESAEEALIRELKEELDIKVFEKDLEFFALSQYRYPHFQLFMPLYICRNYQGEISPCEGQNYVWVAPQDLFSYEMPPADLVFLPKLARL